MNSISVILIGYLAIAPLQPVSTQVSVSNAPDAAASVQSHDTGPADTQPYFKPTTKSRPPISYARSGKEIAAGQIIDARRNWLLERSAKLTAGNKKTVTPKAE